MLPGGSQIYCDYGCGCEQDASFSSSFAHRSHGRDFAYGSHEAYYYLKRSLPYQEFLHCAL